MPYGAMTTLDTTDLLLPGEGPPVVGAKATAAARTEMEGRQPPTMQPMTSWLFQSRVLVVRFVRSWQRSLHLLTSFVAQYMFAGIFIGEHPRGLCRVGPELRLCRAVCWYGPCLGV